MNKILRSMAVILLLPSMAHANDMTMIGVIMFIPFLLVGAGAALALRAAMNKDPERQWPRRLLLAILFTVGVPGGLIAILSLSYLASSEWGSALIYLAAFGGFFWAARSAFRTYSNAVTAGGGTVRIGRLALIWLGIAAAVIGFFIARDEYQTREYQKRVKEAEIKRLNMIILYGSAPFAPREGCAAGDCESDWERLRLSRTEAEADGKAKMLAEVKKLGLKQGGTVGDAISADPALKKNLLAAVANSEVLSDSDCRVWRSTCSIGLGFLKPSLAGLGFDIIDPGRQNYDANGKPILSGR